ncbi:hypothetical protein LCGC14_1755740 [marine sediment metagenome]|uniref:Uncharacterized protein n=1 Tax=marine sediment metagenome TaxID=412755 RepID=A0A0F9K273_9ZZZZ
MRKLFEQIKLWASIICGIAVIVMLIGCTATASRKGDELTLKGWGATSATWEKDGEKYSITKEEAVKVPDILPTR